LSLDGAVQKGDRLVVKVPEGEAVLTLVPRVQQHVTELLKRYDVPQGSFVAVEPATGRVLALASFSAKNPKDKPFGVRAVAPAVLRHRIVTNFTAEAEGIRPERIIEDLLKSVPTE